MCGECSSGKQPQNKTFGRSKTNGPERHGKDKVRIYGLDKLTGGFYFGQVILVTGERGFEKSTLVSPIWHTSNRGWIPYIFLYSGELMDWYFKAWIEYQIAGARNINALISDYGYKSYSIQADKLQQIENWYAGKAYIYDNGIVTEDTEEENFAGNSGKCY